MMEQDSDTIWCDGCGAEVPGLAVTLDLNDYCCVRCAEGLGCACRSVDRAARRAETQREREAVLELR